MRTVLIIDCEPVLAEFMANALESDLGCQTVIACGEKQAAAVLFNKRFDLIISDTFSDQPFHPTNTGGDRWQWLDMVRNLAPDTPLIAVTSYARYYYADYRWHGLLALLPKPFKADELIEAALRALATDHNLEPLHIFDTNKIHVSSVATGQALSA